LACIHEFVLKKEQHSLEFFYWIENASDYYDIDLSTTSHGFEIAELKWVDIYNPDLGYDLYPLQLLDWLRDKE
jgi:hypothetical protein